MHECGHHLHHALAFLGVVVFFSPSVVSCIFDITSHAHCFQSRRFVFKFLQRFSHSSSRIASVVLSLHLFHEVRKLNRLSTHCHPRGHVLELLYQTGSAATCLSLGKETFGLKGPTSGTRHCFVNFLLQKKECFPFPMLFDW